MRVLWISCLLFGSIICVPVEYDNGFDMEYDDMDTYPMQEANGGDANGGDAHIAADDDGYAADDDGYAADDDGYAADDDGYAADDDGYAGPRSYRSNKVVGDDWFTSGYTRGDSVYTDTSGEENKPVFSDVSGLEPVYTTGSRSRYQRGRAVFAQTRYTPTESFGLPMPLFSYTSYTLS